MRTDYGIGLDVGGTRIKAVAARVDGQLLRQVCAATACADLISGKPAWLERAVQIVAELEAEFGRAACVGVAAPGLAAADGLSIAHMPGRMNGLEGLSWGVGLNRNDAVPVLNDAHAALLGEIWCGAAKGCRNVMLLTLGTGVGGAVVVDGHLLRGQIGRAGHLGHISLNPDGAPDIVRTPGSLEDAIGDCTVLARSGGKFDSTEALVAAHRAGDEIASEVWRKSVKALAAGISGLINVLDPEMIVIGGGIAQAGDALFEPLNEYLNAMEWRPACGASEHRVKIIPAALGEYAGALGALSAAYSKV